jgi:hypothetical protein
VIVYRKAQPLRVRRVTGPEPPFWCASIVQPYGTRRALPLAIDYGAMRASSADKLEVTVCEDVADELERMRPLASPVLIDAAEAAEEIFRRGEAIAAFCAQQERTFVHLVSTAAALPLTQRGDSIVTIACWPPEPSRIGELFAEAARRELSWGAAVPLLYPLTTDLQLLEQIADLAAASGARFLAGLVVDADATARQAIAQLLNLDHDDDRYALMFHGSIEPLLLSSERHLAALAHERGLADFVVPPRWDERSNWNAAVLLTLTASRMMAMELDLDLAGTIARSARLVAELDKPLARVAESASIAIVGGLDETSVEMLTEWIDRRPAPFAEYVNEQWRLRRG